MNISASVFAQSIGQASDDDMLHGDVSDAALEAAVMTAVPGAAMSVHNAPTASMVLPCCGFNGPGRPS